MAPTGLFTRLLGFATDYWALHPTIGHFPDYWAFTQKSMFDPNGRNAPPPSPEHCNTHLRMFRWYGAQGFG